MARPRSRFRERARTKAPSRAARRARSVKFPAGPTLAYRKAIAGIVRSVLASVRTIVDANLQQFAYQPPDERKDASDIDVLKRIKAAGKPNAARVKKATSDASKAVDRHVEKEIERIGITFAESVPGLASAITGWRNENTKLITSLLDGQVEKLTTLLADNQNRRVEALSERIQELFEITESKADLLARDQTLKLNGQITEARQTAAGIEEFLWTTSQDERVRESHEELDGQRFRWDDPPEVDGEVATPGSPYQCRCVAFPVLPEASDD